MIVMANCMRFVPTGNGLRKGEAVQVAVEVDRVLHTGGHCGYQFGLTAESEKRLADMEASGAIEWADDLPHCWKKDFPSLRIPVLKGGQQARLINGKCGQVEKAVYRHTPPPESPVEKAKRASQAAKQGAPNGQ